MSPDHQIANRLIPTFVTLQMEKSIHAINFVNKNSQRYKNPLLISMCTSWKKICEKVERGHVGDHSRIIEGDGRKRRSRGAGRMRECCLRSRQSVGPPN